MKELLYIPSGRYVKFNCGQVSIEEYLTSCLAKAKLMDNHTDSFHVIWETSYDNILKAFYEGRYTETTYKSAEIDTSKPILESEFELIDT
jgi:hypothetical protein